MSLKRILKLLAAFLTGQGVSIVIQLVVPPLFLHRYAHGMELYGEWIALTAAISYIGTLNYGIQNYANNQMAIHYNRGERQKAQTVQASALRLILIVVVALGLVAVASLFLPLAGWIGVRFVSSREASLTVFYILLQLISGFPFSLLTNSYMVIGQQHRGQNWQNAQRMVAAMGLSVCAWLRMPLSWLALTQAVSMLLFAALVIMELRMRAPFLLPSLRHGTWAEVRAQIKPSSYFMLLALSSFLVWQGPILVIQRVLGPAAVTIFALSRTIFSMSRQVLNVATQAIGQDISCTVGRRDWPGLKRLYDLSEKVILLITPVSTIGTLLACPLLFSLWLHQRSIYNPGICLLMAVVSAIIAIKEHKYQFQWSSNRHEELSKYYFVSNLAMLALSGLLMKSFGVGAFMVCWGLSELGVTLYIVHLNMRLFPPEIHVSARPIFHLFALLAVAFSAAWWPVYRSAQWGLGLIAAETLLAMLLLTAVGYYLFGLDEVYEVIKRRIKRKTASA
jgi:O-antigen/teichoic acid export membrane protein